MNFTPATYEFARGFSNIAHNVADNSYDGQDYLVHLDNTYNAFVTYPVSRDDFNDIVAVIYLNDILEKTKVTIDEISCLFSDNVVQAVVKLSETHSPNRKERIARQNEKLMSLNPSNEVDFMVLTVSAYKRFANFNYSVLRNNKKKAKMYYKEAIAFKEAAYRFNICEELWVELDRLQERAVSRFDF